MSTTTLRATVSSPVVLPGGATVNGTLRVRSVPPAASDGMAQTVIGTLNATITNGVFSVLLTAGQTYAFAIADTAGALLYQITASIPLSAGTYTEWATLVQNQIAVSGGGPFMLDATPLEDIRTARLTGALVARGDGTADFGTVPSADVAGLDALASDVATHLADTANPHATTAAQTGAYTAAQTDAAITAAVAVETTRATTAETTNATAITNETTRATTAEGLKLAKASNLSDVANAATARGNLGAAAQTDLTAHTGNVANPHATTAAQTGAYTTAQTDAAIATETTRATTAEGLKLAKSSNLSDVADAATARANIGANNASNLTTGTWPQARSPFPVQAASIDPPPSPDPFPAFSDEFAGAALDARWTKLVGNGVEGGTATAVGVAGSLIQITVPPIAAVRPVIFHADTGAAAGDAFTIVSRVLGAFGHGTYATPQWGAFPLVLREQATDKHLLICFGYDGTQYSMRIMRTGAATNYDLSAVITSKHFRTEDCRFRARVSGGNIYFDIANGGQNWRQVYTELITATFTTGPDRAGFGGYAQGTTFGSDYFSVLTLDYIRRTA